MGKESATYVDGLVSTNPLGSDSISVGDDHIRMIKSVLKNSFPNVTTATTPLVGVGHTIQSASASMRSESYIDTGFSITYNKSSTTSTLYVQLCCSQHSFSSWDDLGCANFLSYIRLANSSGALIGGTTDNIQISDMRDLVPSGCSTVEVGNGFSYVWKVIAANCPDGTSGNNTFDIWAKINDADDGGLSLSLGNITVWEVEQ